jgi:hypothetical protein
MLFSLVLVVCTLVLVRQIVTVAMMYKANVIGTVPHLIVLFLLLLLGSCTKDDIFPPICIGGDCSAEFYIDYPQDENGYYHIDLNFDQEYLPKFDIKVGATVTHPYWWYNDSPVVVAVFETDSYWRYENDLLPAVQGSRVYFKQVTRSKATTKRIVGPFPPEMIGDTITIYPTIMWDAGNAYEKQTFSLKFIVK